MRRTDRRTRRRKAVNAANSHSHSCSHSHRQLSASPCRCTSHLAPPPAAEEIVWGDWRGGGAEGVGVARDISHPRVLSRAQTVTLSAAPTAGRVSSLRQSSRAERGRVEPSRAEPPRAGRVEPSRAGPSRAEPGRVEPRRVGRRTGCSVSLASRDWFSRVLPPPPRRAAGAAAAVAFLFYKFSSNGCLGGFVGSEPSLSIACCADPDPTTRSRNSSAMAEFYPNV